MTINNTIRSTVNVGSPSVQQAGFGVTCLLGLATFGDNIRYYTSYAEVVEDSSLITAAQLAGAAAAFAGNNPPNQLAIGKLASFDTPTAQVDTVSVGGNDAGDYTITVNGNNKTYTADGVETANDIATALATLVDTLTDVSAVASTSDVVITSAYPGVAITTAVANDDGNLSVSTTTPNAPGVVGALNTFLADITASGDTFLGLVIDSRDKAIIEPVSDWCETNGFVFMGQTSDADVANNTGGNILETLGDKSYLLTGLIYYTEDTERADAAWITNKLAANPDEQATTWSRYTLVGIPTEQHSATVQNNVVNNNGNVYTTQNGIGATWPGKAVNGEFLDLTITALWLEARIQEDCAQILLDASNNNEKIPYDDDGIGVFVNAIQRRLDQGIRVGHFIDGTDVINAPKLSDIAGATRRARELTITYSVEPAGSIEELTITGTVSIPI